MESVSAIAATPAAPSERQAFQSRKAAAEAFFGKYEPVPDCFDSHPLWAR